MSQLGLLNWDCKMPRPIRHFDTPLACPSYSLHLMMAIELLMQPRESVGECKSGSTTVWFFPSWVVDRLESKGAVALEASAASRNSSQKGELCSRQKNKRRETFRERCLQKMGQKINNLRSVLGYVITLKTHVFLCYGFASKHLLQR